MREKKPWYQYPARGIGINMWAPPWYPESIVNFDAEKIADAVANNGASVCYTFQGFTTDIYGMNFYPTKTGPLHPNLHGRDFTQEYTDALHQRNVKIFGYYHFTEKTAWDSNPDWRQLDAQEQEITAEAWGGFCCPNSPYREYFLDRLREIVTRYPLDGFLVGDNLEFAGQGCYCRYCQRKFRERYGKALPRTHNGADTDWMQFVNWRYDCIDELYHELWENLKAIRPEMVFTHNSYALAFWNYASWPNAEDCERIYQYDDVVTGMAHWTDGRTRPTGQVWKAGMLTRVLRGLSGKPVWMQIGRNPYERDYLVMITQELTLATASVAANGGCPMFIDSTYPDSTIDELAYERMGAALAGLHATETYLEYEDELPFAALFFSRRSQDYLELAFPGERRYLVSFQGAYKALQEGHILFQVIGEARLTDEALAKYKVVIIPNATVMSEEQVAIFERYVRQGGALIGTATTSLLDADMQARENFGLSALFGADYVSPFNYSTSYLKPVDHVICQGIDPRQHLIHRGLPLQQKVRPHEAVEIVAMLEYPVTEITDTRHITHRQDVPHGRVSNYPAAIASRVGAAGRCVYFAGDITGVYGVYGYPELRRLLLNAVRWCCDDQLPLTVRAPLSLETSCYRNGNRYVLHLLNHTTSQLALYKEVGGPMVEESIPCPAVPVTLQVGTQTPRAVFLAHSGAALPFTVADGAVSFTVPQIALHEMVVIECG